MDARKTGIFIAQLRKELGLTQKELADALNVSDKAISRWEHAETLPDIETLCKICDIYGVSGPHSYQQIICGNVFFKIFFNFIERWKIMDICAGFCNGIS